MELDARLDPVARMFCRTRHRGQADTEPCRDLPVCLACAEDAQAVDKLLARPRDAGRFAKLHPEPPAQIPEGYTAPLDMRLSRTLIAEKASSSPAPAAPVDEIGALVDRICHEEQMQIWSHEIAVRLSMGDYLRDGLTYEDKIHIHREVEVEIRSIVESVVGNPEVRAALAAIREGPAATGERREASFDPATGRCFGEGEGAADGPG